MQRKEQTSNAKRHLKDIFLTGLKDIYWAELALTKKLPEMEAKATDVRLKTAIKDHCIQTYEQVARLEQVFELMGEKAEGKKCLAMEGILKEGDESLADFPQGAGRDSVLIAACQKVEHYEITSYGTLAAYAKTLNERQVQQLLLRTLGEEKKSDCLLTTIADTDLNSRALSQSPQSKNLKAV